MPRLAYCANIQDYFQLFHVLTVLLVAKYPYLQFPSQLHCALRIWDEELDAKHAARP